MFYISRLPTISLRILCLALCACLMGTVVIFADNTVNTPGGSGHTELVLVADSPMFNVTVPTVLAIGMSGSGDIYTYSGAKIINYSGGPIEVTGMEIRAKNGWKTANWDTFDPQKISVNTKELAFEINGCATTGQDAIAFDASKFNVAMGYETNENEIPITYDAKIPLQGEILKTAGLVDVYFILSWHTAN